jgi:hypothetical protein
MKILLLIPLAAIAMFSSSCRTNCPLDPLTMQPDCSLCTIPAHPSSCRCGGHAEVQVEYSK